MLEKRLPKGRSNWFPARHANHRMLTSATSKLNLRQWFSPRRWFSPKEACDRNYVFGKDKRSYCAPGGCRGDLRGMEHDSALFQQLSISRHARRHRAEEQL